MGAVGHGGELYTVGLQLLGDDDLVRTRPELFVRFDLGYRAVVAAIAELERAEREEQAQARAAAQKEGPPEPESSRRAIAVKSFTHGDASVKVGDVFPSDALIVAQVNHAFVIAED